MDRTITITEIVDNIHVYEWEGDPSIYIRVLVLPWKFEIGDNYTIDGSNATKITSTDFKDGYHVIGASGVPGTPYGAASTQVPTTGTLTTSLPGLPDEFSLTINGTIISDPILNTTNVQGAEYTRSLSGTGNYFTDLLIRDSTGAFYILNAGSHFPCAGWNYGKSHVSETTTTSESTSTSLGTWQTSPAQTTGSALPWYLYLWYYASDAPGQAGNGRTIHVIDGTQQIPYGFNETMFIKLSSETIDRTFSAFAEYTENDNPYATGSEGMGKGGGGGRGKWSDSASSDPVPGLEIADSGMVSIYTPTAAQIKSLSEYLWSDLFSLDTFKKLLSDPFQALITLHALPIATSSSSVAEVTVGNIGTGVNMNVLDKQWYKISMGSVSVDEYYGSFFDYSPYTKFQIWLPYIGYQAFNPDDFVGGTCTVEYVVDALTGACSARLISSKVNNSVLYQYSGSMAYQIPMTKNDWASTISSVFSFASSVAGMVGGISGASSTAAKVGAAISGGSSAMNSVVNSAPTIARSGSIGGASGWAAQQTPYIIRVRPRAIVPKNQQKFTGYPSYKTKVLSGCKGYTEVEEVRLEGLSATDSEKNEIINLLKSGVIL